MHCRPAARDRVRSTARALRDHDHVVAVDALDPDTGPRPRWTLELTLALDHLPPAHASEIVDAGLSIQYAQPKGACYRVVATA